jgi:hypothetical protein
MRAFITTTTWSGPTSRFSFLTLRDERPFRDPKDLDIPNRSDCFQLVSRSTLGTPADPRDAEMETYGPVATKGGSIYAWNALPDLKL